jgi:hypothetical protein
MGVSGSEKKTARRLLPIANRAEGPCAYVREVCLDGEREADADSGRQAVLMANRVALGLAGLFLQCPDRIHKVLAWPVPIDQW